MAKPMKIMMVTSELFPYAKAGGLADVVPKLAEALDAEGHQVKIILPRYYFVTRYLLEKLPSPLGIPMGDREYWTGVFYTILPGTRVEVFFLDYEDLYGRDGIYGESGKSDFPDNLIRFGLLSKAAFQLCKLLDWFPDIVHAHDWPAAPALAYLKSVEAVGPFRRTRGVFSIHNLGYQGIFPHSEFASLGFSGPDEERLGFAYHGSINFLRAALVCADGVTTVSPGYAAEILEPELGFAMDGLLREKKERFVGILNGMDYDVWNPRTDQLVPCRYDAATLSKKLGNKRMLQKQAGFDIDESVPLVGMVSRLVTQKGFAEFIAEDGKIIERITALPCQLVILGTGEKVIETRLSEIARRIDGFHVYILYNERMSHLIEAGSDFFLMPSMYEPCGLTQMYALRYGTVPIVSPTGGLKNTVTDYFQDPEHATGFHLPVTLSGEGIAETLERACAIYRDEPETLLAMRKRGMKKRFDWKASAKEYSAFYESIRYPV